MRATRALIHLENLTHNIQTLRRHTANPARPAAAPGSSGGGHSHGKPMICLAVKADAYGHGIVEVGRHAASIGVEYLAVATVDEAVELRRAGIGLPILLYSLPTPDEIADIMTHDATPVVSDVQLADLLNDAAGAHGKRIPVHMKVDTGMGRIGCTPEDASELARHISACGNLQLAGISTHFAASDTTDQALTRKQISRFEQALSDIRASGIDPGIVHAGNSGGVLSYPEAWYDMIRPGILAYGYYPSDDVPREYDFRPVMDLRSRVILIKQVEAGTTVSYGATWSAPGRTFIGTIPVGYGDGYSRLLSSTGRVVIGGRSYPIVGRVCMDHIMVDLGPECAVERYDDVVLFGPTEGGPTAEELAALCGTISYEITCAVSKRVPRIYLH